MRYIIDIPDGLHQKIARLVADGKYSTIQDFAFAALQNQLLLEESYQGANGSQLVLRHQSAVADHIGAQQCCQSVFEVVVFQVGLSPLALVIDP